MDTGILPSSHFQILAQTRHYPHGYKNCLVALFLPTMDKPKHRTLVNIDSKWFFQSGKGSKFKISELLHFNSVTHNMIQQFILFEGHKKLKMFFISVLLSNLKAAVANHVSAHDLTSLIPS